jgi:hypothetical protein
MPNESQDALEYKFKIQGEFFTITTPNAQLVYSRDQLPPQVIQILNLLRELPGPSDARLAFRSPLNVQESAADEYDRSVREVIAKVIKDCPLMSYEQIAAEANVSLRTVAAVAKEFRLHRRRGKKLKTDVKKLSAMAHKADETPGAKKS